MLVYSAKDEHWVRDPLGGDIVSPCSRQLKVMISNLEGHLKEEDLVV